MEYSIVIILIALLQYIFFTGRTGFSRVKYGVQAPKTVGNETWERIFRVQQNTMEQLIIFIPGMLIFSMYVSQTWVLLPGILFVIGRQIYSHLYIKNPESRGPGMVLSFFSNIALVLGGLISLGLSVTS
ncbi:MAG: MAPEG family protein [Methylococcales bacterium]